MPKSEQIRQMFDGIAPRYDLLNHLLSAGVDRGWRKRAVRAVYEGHPSRVLDVATGTGDLAIAIARALPACEVTGVDLSQQMLAVGAGKLAGKGLRVTLTEGDACALAFADGVFDAVSVAFGVRNFEDVVRGVGEMARVLRQGGRLVILEFSTPRKGPVARLYRLYFHRLLPFVGGLISGDRSAYRYLPTSVDGFPAPEEFLGIMRRAGLTQCRATALTGGIARLYVGIKA